MERVACRNCGAREFRRDDGVLVCNYCQSQFAPPAPSRSAANGPVPALSQSSIDMRADIEALLQKCRDDPGNRLRYASLVLDLDPMNEEARRYLL